MESFFNIVVFIFTALFIHAKCDGLVDISNLRITKMESCDSSVDYPLKFTNKFRIEGGKQLITGKAEFKVNFGEDSDYNATVNYKKTRDSAEFTQLLKLYEKDACVAIEKYLGNFLHTVEKACGMEPGKCPIEKGTYSLTDYPLDYSQLVYKSLLPGVFQSMHVVTSKTTKEVLMCVVVETEVFSDATA